MKMKGGLPISGSEYELGRGSIPPIMPRIRIVKMNRSWVAYLWPVAISDSWHYASRSFRETLMFTLEKIRDSK